MKTRKHTQIIEELVLQLHYLEHMERKPHSLKNKFEDIGEQSGLETGRSCVKSYLNIQAGYY